MQDRVCYFSKDDLSVGHYLEMAEKRIQEVAEGNVPTDLESVIELWHIKRMIDDECRFLEWTDEKFNTLKQATSGYNNIIAKFFNALDPKILKSEFELLEWTYKKTLWQIIDAYKLYKLIEPETLREILVENINNLRMVLECQGIVEKFKVIIREILLNNANSAHIILDKYVAKRDSHRDTDMHLPSNLTIEDKEQIIINYLQSDDPNVNYVRLITQIKDDKNNIKLSPKTRLLAERQEKKLNDLFLQLSEGGELTMAILQGEYGVPRVYKIPLTGFFDISKIVLEDCKTLSKLVKDHRGKVTLLPDYTSIEPKDAAPKDYSLKPKKEGSDGLDNSQDEPKDEAPKPEPPKAEPPKTEEPKTDEEASENEKPPVQLFTPGGAAASIGEDGKPITEETKDEN